MSYEVEIFNSLELGMIVPLRITFLCLKLDLEAIQI